MAEVPMPRLSDSMVEGTVVRWLVSDGDQVSSGQELVEIETDKATMGYEAEVAGTIQLLVEEGSTVAVGESIAIIGAAAEPEPRGVAASPIAKRVAGALGVDLGVVNGSGPRGRILKADVVEFAANGDATPRPEGAERAPVTAERAPESAKGAVEIVELTRIQSVVARRMAESRATIPEFSLSAEVDMTEAVELRAKLKREVEPAPTLNDLLVRATGVTLRRHPRVNGCYSDGRFELFERVNVGFAVAAADALLVPTVHDPDQRSLGQIAERTRELATRVRNGSITPPELAGGTFTVSNLGMFGIDSFAGVINPGQAAILCAGSMVARPIVEESGQLRMRQTMLLTLVCDHRILYGADGAAFLSELRAAVERPLGLLV